MKKSVSMISKIININADFRIFVNVSHSIFLKKKKKHKNSNKIKPKLIPNNRGHTFAENSMIFTCAKIQWKVLMFGEVAAPESSFGD